MGMQRVQPEYIRQAVEALKSLREDVPADKKLHLFDAEDEFVFLLVTFKQIPNRKLWKPYSIPLPHPIYEPGTSEICFIVKDPQRQVKDHLAERGCNAVSKVIGVTKLRKKYSSYALKRQLVQSYDLFLADDRVVPMLSKILGKEFFRKKKIPIPVHMNRDVRHGIEKSLKRTYLFFVDGPCSSIRVGKMNFDCEEIVDNVKACVERMMVSIPGGWENVQSLLLKTNKSMSLPIFESSFWE
eukprot:jgi/Galph1/5617/GphlegSOOS_G4274.1